MPLSADCKTISGGADNGYLACASRFFGNPPTNNTNLQAITNLLGCVGAGTKSAIIIGHGNTGFIKTGNGNAGGSDDQYLGNWNRPKWLQYVLNLRNKCSVLTLCGCSVGAGDPGADLLYYLATSLNCTVTAPTFDVWCGGGNVYLDPKAKWQTAVPGVRPTPIPAPTIEVAEMALMNFGPAGQPVAVPVSAVRELSLVRINLRGQRTSKTFTSDEAHGIVQLVDFGHPMYLDARPAAVETGELSIRYLDGATENVRTFKIYNDTLLEDIRLLGTFYRASQSFSLALSQLI